MASRVSLVTSRLTTAQHTKIFCPVKLEQWYSPDPTLTHAEMIFEKKNKKD